MPLIALFKKSQEFRPVEKALAAGMYQSAGTERRHFAAADEM